MTGLFLSNEAVQCSALFSFFRFGMAMGRSPFANPYSLECIYIGVEYARAGCMEACPSIRFEAESGMMCFMANRESTASTGTR